MNRLKSIKVICCNKHRNYPEIKKEKKRKEKRKEKKRKEKKRKEKKEKKEKKRKEKKRKEKRGKQAPACLVLIPSVSAKQLPWSQRQWVSCTRCRCWHRSSRST